jgi:RHS repeat-associated protein
VVALVDSNGAKVEEYIYDAYGKVTSKNSTATTHNPYGYTGRIMDDDDLYYYRARYYDPTTQRFLSEDPIGLDAGDMNFYRYVGNSPVNLVDPQGLWTFGISFNFGWGGE